MTGFFLCGVEEDCGTVGEAGARSRARSPSPVRSSLNGAVAERAQSQRMTVHRCQRITYCLTIDGTGVLGVVHRHSSFVGGFTSSLGKWPSDGDDLGGWLASRREKAGPLSHNHIRKW